MNNISEAFKEHFAPFELTLPEPIVSPQQFSQKGWTITTRPHTDPAGNIDYVNITAEHRTFGTSYLRIMSTGEIIGYEGFMDHYTYDENDPDSRTIAQQKMQEHNAKVAEKLRTAGFIS